MDGRDSCMMLGPIECKTYSCIECEKRDDIWCNELNCCLDIWLHPKANCPYLIHVVVDNIKVVEMIPSCL